MSRLISHPYIDLVLHARVTVLVATAGAIGALLVAGFAPLGAVAIALAGVLGGLEVGRQLTLPYFAPKARVHVIVVIVILIVNVVRLGCPAPLCVALVLGGAWCTAVLARRVTCLVFQQTSRSA